MVSCGIADARPRGHSSCCAWTWPAAPSASSTTRPPAAAPAAPPAPMAGS
jgi:hypothetical protein